MKTVTTTMLITLAVAALVVLFAALAALVGERAVALAHSGQDNLLFVALACGCAALSICNGFGKSTRRAVHAARERVEANGEAHARHASIIHLGN
ncbi:MAG: hypothetical protein LC754_16435 [Acidobacteria bacterium]|nr:hypothetical protein [Acidobacteriota bacterium]